MRFDAPTFARAWLQVANACAADGDIPVLNRTMALEEYVWPDTVRSMPSSYDRKPMLR